ncbi:hypothetical protein KGF54_005063 [Candida jiufengensis]|uniref:uncharacterized protein n=1 Tax=Candida jiufengensis TaxID=497108 RepID=UPI0022254354|nr:uncharacterized protein KGF54_005063 [Candida jiufengensis]KAI5951988.1 hypothetical protein KGF54_005063 [Candida jiufengensis]
MLPLILLQFWLVCVVSPLSLLNQVVKGQTQVYNYQQTIKKLWGRFFEYDKITWNYNDNICQDNAYEIPSLWDTAVVGKAITNLNSIKTLKNLITAILQYYDPTTGAFAGYPNSTDIYSDDNARICWVFIDAYTISQDDKYLGYAEGIMKYLKTQNFNDTGGIIWQNDQNYIASISTVETALAAVRLYEVNGDESLIDLAHRCLKFMFDYFQDPNDKLFYDGLDKTAFASVNKGKLSYTVGCCLSLLSKLYLIEKNKIYLNKIFELATAATNRSCGLYTNTIWNNSLQNSHLLFNGFRDIFQIGSQFDQFKPEVFRQANYIYQFLQDPKDKYFYFDSVDCGYKLIYSNFASKFNITNYEFIENPNYFCNGNLSSPTKKSLITNASVAQILYSLSNM